MTDETAPAVGAPQQPKPKAPTDPFSVAQRHQALNRGDPFAFDRALSHIKHGVATVGDYADGGRP